MSTFIVTNGKPVITKDPDATLDYQFDWTAWLADISDTLSTATVAVSGVQLETTLGTSGITVSGSKVTAWVKGGIVGETGTATCSIVTTAGRKDDRTVYFDIAQR